MHQGQYVVPLGIFFKEFVRTKRRSLSEYCPVRLMTSEIRESATEWVIYIYIETIARNCSLVPPNEGMNLDDRGIKHEAESMSGVVRGALFKFLLDGQSLCLCPALEFQMGYKTKSCLKSGREFSS